MNRGLRTLLIISVLILASSSLPHRFIFATLLINTGIIGGFCLSAIQLPRYHTFNYLMRCLKLGQYLIFTAPRSFGSFNHALIIIFAP